MVTNNKDKRNFWEKLFVYPSFNIRFGSILLVVFVVFAAITYATIFNTKAIDGLVNQLSFLNLIIQSATLLLGIFGAYYALRQLVETRFTGLDEAGMNEFKDKHYLRAFNKWKEALYIHPEASVFINMCQALLLLGDFDRFDSYIRMSEHQGTLKQEIFEEKSDQVMLLFLKAQRHLLTKNQGEAEKFLAKLVAIISSEKGLIGFQKDFIDLRTSRVYQDLSGECKNMAENLIDYLSKDMVANRIVAFEAGNFASQIV